MTEMQPEMPSVISALRWQFLARQGRGVNAKCSFHLLQILAAMLLLLSNKDVNDKSIEKLVFVKWLCEAGSKKEQCCDMRSDSTSNQNFPMRFICVLKFLWLEQTGM